MRISDWSSDVCSSDLAVITRQRDHEQQFGDEPALAPIIAVEGEHQPEYPDDDQRRIQDDPPQPVLALDPFPVLVGPDGRLLVIDEKRSEEHTSELQSLMRISYAVFCLKKKRILTNIVTSPTDTLHNH